MSEPITFSSPEETQQILADMTAQMCMADVQLKSMKTQEQNIQDRISDEKFKLRQCRKNQHARKDWLRERAAIVIREKMGVELIAGHRSKYLSSRKFFEAARLRAREAREAAKKITDLDETIS